jgi:hypothetical protein
MGLHARETPVIRVILKGVIPFVKWSRAIKVPSDIESGSITRSETAPFVSA